MLAMQATREAARLPGLSIDPRIECTSDLARAATAEFTLAAAPAQAFREVARALGTLPGDGALIICAKGIERGSGAFLSDISRELLPRRTPAVLSGPSFARDVAAGLPTAVTLAASDERLAESLAAVLAGPGFRLYSSSDVRGVEIGGAAKNVLAIASGVAEGQGLGPSASAALVARGFSEMRRFANAYGARPETLMGLSGLGDLVLTCGSAQSRNFALGLALGRGLDPARAFEGDLAEGAFTAPIFVDMARARGVDVPIAQAVEAILSRRWTVGQAIEALLARPLRSET
jgi:glycerol-3-phosphate dehydrogenase (NAD(P)+)